MILATFFFRNFSPKCKIWVSEAQITVFFYSSSALNLHLKVFTKLHGSISKKKKKKKKYLFIYNIRPKPSKTQ